MGDSSQHLNERGAPGIYLTEAIAVNSVGCYVEGIASLDNSQYQLYWSNSME
jgi:hypothetical protein